MLNPLLKFSALLNAPSLGEEQHLSLKMQGREFSWAKMKNMGFFPSWKHCRTSSSHKEAQALLHDTYIKADFHEKSTSR